MDDCQIFENENAQNIPWGHFLMESGDRVDAPLSDVEGFHLAKVFDLNTFPLNSKYNLFWSDGDKETPVSVLEREKKIVNFQFEKDKRKGALRDCINGYYSSVLLAVADSKEDLEKRLTKKRIQVPSFKNLAMARPKAKKSRQNNPTTAKKEKSQEKSLKSSARMHNLVNVLGTGSDLKKELTITTPDPNAISAVDDQEQVIGSDQQLEKLRGMARFANVTNICPNSGNSSKKEIQPEKKRKLITDGYLSSEVSSDTIPSHGSGGSSDIPNRVYLDLKTKIREWQEKYEALKVKHEETTEELKNKIVILEKENDRLKKRYTEVQNEMKLKSDSAADELSTFQKKFDKNMSLNVAMQIKIQDFNNKKTGYGMSQEKSPSTSKSSNNLVHKEAPKTKDVGTFCYEDTHYSFHKSPTPSFEDQDNFQERPPSMMDIFDSPTKSANFTAANLQLSKEQTTPKKDETPTVEPAKVGDKRDNNNKGDMKDDMNIMSPTKVRNRMKQQKFNVTDNQIDTVLTSYKKRLAQKLILDL